MTNQVHKAAERSAAIAAACICQKEHTSTSESSHSIWYANPPFRVNHFAKRTLELEWEDESVKGGTKPVPVNVTYLPKGNYLLQVFFILLWEFFRYDIHYFRNPHLTIYVSFADGWN